MNYEKIYNAIIKKARERTIDEYTESHHIIPKCLNGTDDKTNLVNLTPEEHFLCHVLLVKVYPNDKNLILAVSKMCQPLFGRRKRKLYGWLKRMFSARMREIASGSKNSQHGTFWANDGSVTKKFKKDETLPDGWKLGRRIVTEDKPYNRYYKKCKTCKIRTTGAKNYCDEHTIKRVTSKETKMKQSETIKRKIQLDPVAFSNQARSAVQVRWSKRE